MGECE